MGFADRDYSRAPYGGGRMGNFSMWSVTTWLIAINVAVFLVDLALGGTLTDLGHFSLNMAVYHGQVWRFITFQFLHAGVQHIFLNMLGLYFFGPLIETYLGSRRYLAFYLLCGIGGALGNLLLNYLGLLNDGPMTELVGASAGIYGILVAAGMVAPDVQVLLFMVIPMRLRSVAWLCVGYAVYTVLSAGHNAGGEASHLGGAVVGLLLILNPRLLDFVTWSGRKSMKYGSRRVAYKDWSKDMNL
jgi:membrane associated rhomboid family serine protease